MRSIRPQLVVVLCLLLAGCAGLGGESASTATPLAGTPDEAAGTGTVPATAASTPSESGTTDTPATPTPAPLDSDADGLSNRREANLGTDPTDPDTDGDGLRDGNEVGATDRLPDADPLRKDVYVEIDYMPGERPPAERLDAIESRFAAAPVSNPDGSEGLAVHLLVDEEVPAAATVSGSRRAGPTNDIWDYRDAYAQRIDDGYIYGVAVADARYRDSPAGEVGGYAFGNVFMFENPTDPATPDNILVHELGHALGLSPFHFDGVDSARYSFEQYPSVMNYNAPGDHRAFSDGTHSPTDHDDWAVIERCVGWHVGSGGGGTSGPSIQSALSCL